MALLHNAGFVLADLSRIRAPMFDSKIGVVAEYEPALVEILRRDIDATTNDQPRCFSKALIVGC